MQPGHPALRASYCLTSASPPNPSLERTATGKPAWPRGSCCLSSASRPSRLTGVHLSAQTLGSTTVRWRCSPSPLGRQSPPKPSALAGHLAASSRRTEGQCSSAKVGASATLAQSAALRGHGSLPLGAELQPVSGDAATRRPAPTFTVGSGGGMNGSCANSQRWRISGPRSKPMPRSFALSHRLGSSRAVLPNRSLEWTRPGIALGPRGAHCHHAPRGPSAFPVPAPQLKR